MNFILTRYIYPIENPISLSKNLGITLDNPRTESEVEIIRRYLKVSYDSPNEMYLFDIPPSRPPMNAEKGVITIKSAIKDIRKGYSKTDSYLKHFFKHNSIQDGLLFLSKMWIIARFDDEGSLMELKKTHELLEAKGEIGWMTFLNNDDPFIKNSHRLIDYSCLLSLLCRTKEDEFSNKLSFLLHDSLDELRKPKIDRKLNYFLSTWSLMAYSAKDKNYENWLYFPTIRNKLIQKANELETVLDEITKDKILYVGSLLNAFANKINDERFRLVILVTILEMMLTRNPDTSRFNIEDSISKQFKLKLGILIYLNDKTKNLSDIKKRLSNIYSLKSNIAHGNLKAFEDALKKMGREIKENTYMFTADELAFERIIDDLFSYVKAVLEEYIKDRDFVEFIKEN